MVIPMTQAVQGPDVLEIEATRAYITRLRKSHPSPSMLRKLEELERDLKVQERAGRPRPGKYDV